MRADYDLVIIGDSWSGRWAALAAARYHARVAFIAQYPDEQLGMSLVLQKLSDLLTALECDGLSLPFKTVDALARWMDCQRQKLLSPYSLSRLAHHGVDVLMTPGQFASSVRGRPVFETHGETESSTPGRRLRSRHYLLASPPLPVAPQSPGNAEIHLLPEFFRKLIGLAPPAKIEIYTHQPWTLGLAQALQKLGYAVTLVCGEQLLPYEDQSISFWVQCALEAKGMTIQRGRSTSKLTDAAVVFNPRPQGTYQGLGLENIGINWTSGNNIQVTPQLQIEQSNLHVCGHLLGGYALDGIAQREASLALRNMFFHEKASPDYSQWGYCLPIASGFWRMGVTERQARRLNLKIDVMTRTLEERDSRLFCKLVATAGGKLIGIHLVGNALQQEGESLEQMIHPGLCVSDLGALSLSSALLTAVFEDFAHRWERLKTPQRRDRLESYFRKKRKRFS